MPRKVTISPEVYKRLLLQPEPTLTDDSLQNATRALKVTQQYANGIITEQEWTLEVKTLLLSAVADGHLNK